MFPVSVLHQTTTFRDTFFFLLTLFPVSVLHQTTTGCGASIVCYPLFPVSVLHQTTTETPIARLRKRLFPVSVLHQTTTYACISSDYQRYISEISLQKQRKWLEIICQRSKKVPIALDRPAILSEPCLGSSGYSRTVCR